MSLPDSTAYDDVNNEARADWLAERPELPTTARAELADDGPLGPIITGWRCPSCGTRHRDGSDPWLGGCGECGWVG